MAGGYLTGDGKWETPGNWQTSGAIPTATDDAIIPALLNVDVTDATAVADVDLGLLYVHRGFVHSFGTTGSPIRTAAVLAKLFSSGPCFLESDAGSAGLDINDLQIALARADVVCEVGSVTGDAGEIIVIRANRGRITIKGNVNWEASTSVIYVGSVSNQAGDVDLTIAAGGETLPLLMQNGGRVNAASIITQANVYNGTLVKTDSACPLVHIFSGGICEYEDASVAGDDVIIHVHAGGMLDLLTNSIPKEFDDCFLYPGSMIRYDPDLHTFGGANGLVDMRDGVLP